ncbi:MAG: hypothetical protein CMO40_03945 [Verrucomicrobiaceae bacterium]|nr:hypothetical protein [Verrucomicrobiaceae bacterium]
MPRLRLSQKARGSGRLLALALWAPFPSHAQLPQPDLQTIFPQGAQAGQTTEVTIGGSDLGETNELLFSHPGITCHQIPVEASDFRPARHQPLRYRITISSDVPTGIYEVIASTRLGLTAPRAFAVGSMPEQVHSSNHTLRTAEELPLNTVMNGHADPTAVDHYKIALREGQRIIIRCQAQEIDSRMDGTLAISDSSGHEYQRDRDTIGRDPVLDFTAPKDDTYTVRVHDFAFAGGATYPYRLSASDAPHIDFIDPPAGVPGTTGTFRIYGRNLPGGSSGEGIRLGPNELESIEVTIALSEKPDRRIATSRVHAALVPGMPYRLQANGKESNAVRVGFAAGPILPGEEGREQVISVPSEVHACFESKGDLDYYRFEARQGKPLWIECVANRLRPDSDPVFWIDLVTTNENGSEQFNEVASNDDSWRVPGGKSFPFRNHDCALRFDPAADGTYRIRLHDQTGRGGRASLYRLIIRPVTPDFDLVMTPWYGPSDKNAKGVARQSALIRKGGTTLVRVFALRRNGFREAITLTTAGLPEGVTCPPVVLRSDKDTATLVLHGSPECPSWQGFLKIRGTSGGVERMARAGTISWAIGNWDTEFTRARLSEHLPLSVVAEEKEPIIIQPVQDRYEVEMGGNLELPFKLEKSMGLKGDFVIAVSGLPHAKPPSTKLKQDASEGKLTLSFTRSKEFNVSPGEWTFSLRGTGTIKYRHNLSAVELAQQEEARIGGIEKTILEESARSRAAVEPAREALRDAEKNLATATDEDKVALSKTVAERKALLQKAEQHSKESNERATQASAAKKSASARLAQANERAKETDLKHATHSKLITVVVKPPPPEAPSK